jgi:hypothetical protein
MLFDKEFPSRRKTVCKEADYVELIPENTA